MKTTAPWKEDEIVYVTQHEARQHEEDSVESDAVLVAAVIRAIRRDPKLHAELRMALEHRI